MTPQTEEPVFVVLEMNKQSVVLLVIGDVFQQMNADLDLPLSVGIIFQLASQLILMTLMKEILVVHLILFGVSNKCLCMIMFQSNPVLRSLRLVAMFRSKES